ncbi:MAG TPA: hypothetical protein VLD85_05605 [Anaeromyxobacteraceae bacterium]|nr:hypothetical protein [Anaeromyxobacteraceae bacterium]
MTVTSSSSPSTPRATPRRDSDRAWRVGLLLASAAAATVAAFAMRRLPQARGYLEFVDERQMLGVPNGLNVLSNLAFLVVGLAGMTALLRGPRLRDPRERAPWLVFFAGVVLTSAGSAWFHLVPSLDSLVWDRLPMAVGFMGLLAALVGERVDAAWGRRLLWPLVGVGLASVAYWHLTERAGVGDLRPYLLVQFYPLVALPLLLLLFPARYTGAPAYLVALAAYVAAKVTEFEDGAVYGLGGLMSGHTLKHLLAAAGIAVIAWMLYRRRPLENGQAVCKGASPAEAVRGARAPGREPSSAT